MVHAVYEQSPSLLKEVASFVTYANSSKLVNEIIWWNIWICRTRKNKFL